MAVEIRFACGECGGVMRVGPDLAGKKVRCPKCKAVGVVPAASAPEEKETTTPPPMPPEPPVEPGPTAIREGAPKEGAVPITETVMHVQPEPEERDLARAASRSPERRRERYEPRSAEGGSNVGLIVGLVIGGVVLLLAGGGGLAWYLAASNREAELAEMQMKVREEEDRLARIREKEGMIHDKEKPPLGPPGGIVPELPPGPPGGVVEPAKPFVPDPPQEFVLKGGRYETVADFKGVEPDPRTRMLTKRYRFRAKANTVYWAKVDHFQMNLRLEEPGEGPKAGKVGMERQNLVFVAEKDGDHTIGLDTFRFNTPPPTKLTVREMDGSEALPTGLKLKSGPVALPVIRKAVELNVYDKQLAGAAFTPDGKHVLLSHADGTVSRWETDGPKQTGSFKAGMRLYGMGLDRKGRLYAQTSTSRDPLVVAGRKVGDISVWEQADPGEEGKPLPKPDRVLPLGGVAARMIASPDGKWLYFLDVHNQALRRIDQDTGALDEAKVDGLSPKTVACCLTPNGKKLYCCSMSNRIEVIDAATFRKTGTVMLDRGEPTDIAAYDAGQVLLVGLKQISLDGAFGGSNCLAVDLKGPLPKEAKVIPLPVGHSCRFVRLLPEGRGALFSGDRRITVCRVPDRPALFEAVRQETWIRDYFMPGNIEVGPDGRTVVHDTGVILKAES